MTEVVESRSGQPWTHFGRGRELFFTVASNAVALSIASAASAQDAPASVSDQNMPAAASNQSTPAPASNKSSATPAPAADEQNGNTMVVTGIRGSSWSC